MSNFSVKQIEIAAKEKKVAVCAIGRLENQYAREFVEWYKKLGFDKVFIYDNNYGQEEHFELVLGDHLQSGFVEITNFRDKEVCQLEAYNDCYARHKDEYEWILFVDFDEFLTIKGEKDIHLFMKKYDKYECVLFNWMIMNDNGQVYNTHRPLMERFTTPMDYDRKGGYDFPEDNHVKAMVRGGLDKVEYTTNPHIPSTPLKCCNSKGEQCDQAPWQPYDFSKAYIKHFQYKTAEEWITKKYKRGMPDQTYQNFLEKTPTDNFFKVNDADEFKLEVIKNQRRQLVVVSMTTIPKRKKRLMDNLPALLNQTYRYDKLIINIDDNLSDEDYEWYENLKGLDHRIEINKSEAKWRSCNKLLPTLKLYPHDIIITLDDDVFYPMDTIMELIVEHIKHPDCVIAHEINPIVVNENYITYVNGYDVKLKQVEWGKYLSNCALFPPYTFDGTDLYDYDKMMKCTHGTHDELWFWIQSTINKVQCVGLNYVRSFAPEMLEQYAQDEYCLSAFNNTEEKIEDYMRTINEVYGKKLISAIKSKPTMFTITKDNIYAFMFLLPYIGHMYKDAQVTTDRLTKDWTNKLLGILNGQQPSI